jgi:hypothetical protein
VSKNKVQKPQEEAALVFEEPQSHRERKRAVV